MARPTKRGLDYFPMDTVFDVEIKLLRKTHGGDGFMVWVMTLQTMYRTESGVLKFPSDVYRSVHAEEVGVSLERFDEVIATCVELGLFHWEDEEKTALASRGVQRRLTKVAEERERTRQRYQKGKQVDTPKLPDDSPEFRGEKLPEECDKGNRKESESESETETERGSEIETPPVSDDAEPEETPPPDFSSGETPTVNRPPMEVIRTGDGSVTPGLHKPRDIDDVRGHAAIIGVGRESADKFYWHFEAKGWKDIVNWKAMLQRWKIDDQTRKTNTTNPPRFTSGGGAFI